MGQACCMGEREREDEQLASLSLSPSLFSMLISEREIHHDFVSLSCPRLRLALSSSHSLRGNHDE